MHSTTVNNNNYNNIAKKRVIRENKDVPCVFLEN